MATPAREVYAADDDELSPDAQPVSVASPTGAPGGWVLARRWGPWVVLVAVAAASLAIGMNKPSHPTLAQRTAQIASQVRCPVCQGETAAQSDTPESQQIRDEIQKELQAGTSQSTILNRLESEFGPSILEKPRTTGVALAVWLVPVIAFVAAVAVLALIFLRWRPRRRAARAASPNDEALVAAALSTPDPEHAPEPPGRVSGDVG